MFQHVLVPLDGSHLAEAALPPAATIANKLGASLSLIHVIERNAPDEVHSDRHLTTVEEAKTYLEEMARQLVPPGIAAQLHVHTAEVSDVARSIVEHTQEFQPDLVVLCTHGRGGPREFLFGSIAQQVVALGTTPVLLIRPNPAHPAAEFLCSSILVPLDGDPDHARALPFAAGLARPCEVRLHLVMVVPTPETLAGREAATGRLLPGSTRELLDIDRASAEEYLRAQVDLLASSGLNAAFEVARGDPAAEIVRAAEHVQAGLIVMGVHGTMGSQAFWSRSVPPKVSARTAIPVLLIPIAER